MAVAALGDQREMDPKLVEKLHEKASNAYLQGDVEGALAAWQELLEADPTDERAREGVELCERMTGCESGSVVTTGQSPFAVGSPSETPEVCESTEDLDQDLGDPLDELLEMGAAPAPPKARSTGIPDTPPVVDQGGVLDLSDLRDDVDSSDEDGGFDIDALLSSPAGNAPTPIAGAIPSSLFDDDAFSDPATERAEPETTWHFGVGPETPEPIPPEPEDEIGFASPEEPVEEMVEEPADGPFVDPPPELGAEDVSAASLHRRASELLATALAEMERGNRELALTTLDRLLILDDTNEAAISLKQKLSAEIRDDGADPAATDVAFDRVEIEDDDQDLLELNHEVPEPAEEPARVTAMPFSEELPSLEGTPAEPAEVAPRGKRFTLPAIPGSKKIWIPAAAVIVLGLGFVLWNTLFGSGDGGAENGLPTARVVEHSGGGGPNADPNTNVPEAVVIAEPVKTVEEQLAEVLQQADAALAEAEYAAAVVAFNAALQLDPDSTEIRGRLDAAGESYRIQQVKQERWNKAVRDFDQGNYRAALAYFYRLPDNEHTDSVDRYIRNGWYNLGVTALMNRECGEALDHFGEARRLDSGDPGVLEAADLAVRCRREGSAVIQPLVADLRIRGLEDSP